MIKITDTNFLEFLKTKKFKQALRNELGKPDINGSYLDPSAQAVLDKTEISVRKSAIQDIFNISSIAGIEAFINLKSLSCRGIGLKQLQSLPLGLKSLLVDSNRGIAITTLPEGLISFSCNSCDLTELPALPSTLEILSCSSNKLSSLPTLPKGLKELRCSYNQLTSIDDLPSSITFIDASDNRLTALPDVPAKAISDFEGNKIRKHKKGGNASLFGGGAGDNYFLKLIIMDKLSQSDETIKSKLIELSSDEESLQIYPLLHGYIYEVKMYVEEYKISEAQLLSITELSLDSALEIYTFLDPDWDEEEDDYNITSFEGIEELKNLETIEYYSMVDADTSWAPLLQLPKLKELIGVELCDEVEALTQKGVKIR